MDFMNFDAVIDGVRQGSITPGTQFTHYSGDVETEWEFAEQPIIGTATATPFQGGWWDYPYQGQYVYLINEEFLFVDHSSEGDGEDFTEYWGRLDEQNSLAEVLANYLENESFEMHFAFERYFDSQMFPEEVRLLFQNALESAWFTSTLLGEQLSEIETVLMAKSPVFAAFREFFDSPNDEKWAKVLESFLNERNLSAIYKMYG
jgi:hypothetical protein